MPSGALQIATEVASVAAAPAGVAERAQALLAPLRRLVPFEAARVYLLDMSRRAEHSLFFEGYDEKVRSYLDSPQHLDDVELVGLDRGGPPMRLRDLPVPPDEIRVWAEYLSPAGFREGVGVRLTTSDGRYLGIMSLYTDTTAHPTDAARETLDILSTAMANALDPLRSVSAAAQLVDGAAAGVLICRDGRTQPLPGLPGHPLLGAGSRVLGVAVRQLGEMAHTAFLCPYDADGEDRHLRVTVIACPDLPPAHVMAAVVVAPTGDLSRLTRRELEVLGLIVEGFSNRRIASTFLLTERTIATHLEHILTKLDAPTRTLAAVYALRRGLYIPRPLHRVPQR
ncbi:LuxR C-terminal-related transcriptional regulator [Phytohabitans sp. ZYX-F-186]|uniref:LuxR C-terminal-related transcriptional regulator n=1 Tax=Phytohabitans maris TaxID=3071409 RepID=A0ABU0ZBQ3_9ACTN|nr:LuxR C-terminal-related transcriptional regulator [Phytohabitans sp. ZYX-F-186]MDQ7903864.1 LuxR C-terminal-related transcriptional regulator [Phytohabitans sp. ZYX-F-186]